MTFNKMQLPPSIVRVGTLNEMTVPANKKHSKTSRIQETFDGQLLLGETFHLYPGSALLRLDNVRGKVFARLETFDHDRAVAS